MFSVLKLVAYQGVCYQGSEDCTLSRGSKVAIVHYIRGFPKWQIVRFPKWQVVHHQGVYCTLYAGVPKAADCAPSGGLLYTICRGSKSGRLCTFGGGGGGGLIVHYQGVPIKGLRLDGHASHQCGGHNYM